MKLPRVLGIASSEVREKDWCNAVTCHEGDPTAYAWSIKDGKLGDRPLLPPSDGGDPAPASAVAVSACGNFALVANAGGRVDRSD